MMFEYFSSGRSVDPETTIYDNLEVSARRYPQKNAVYYYGNTISYRKLCDEVNLLAGYLGGTAMAAATERGT